VKQIRQSRSYSGLGLNHFQYESLLNLLGCSLLARQPRERRRQVHPQPQPPNPNPSPLNPKLQTPKPKAKTPNPKSKSSPPNPKPQTQARQRTRRPRNPEHKIQNNLGIECSKPQTQARQRSLSLSLSPSLPHSLPVTPRLQPPIPTPQTPNTKHQTPPAGSAAHEETAKPWTPNSKRSRLVRKGPEHRLVRPTVLPTVGLRNPRT